MTGRSSDKTDAIGSSNSSNSSSSRSSSRSSSKSASGHQTSEAVSLCRQARTLWLRNATAAEDLDRVEDLYRRALNSKRAAPVRAASANKKRKRSEPRSAGTETKMVAALSPEEYRKAGERLSLLYLQSGRPYKATPGLKYLGFECRLSERILNYPLKVPSESGNGKGKRNRRVHKNGGNNGNGKSSMPKPPCCVVDNFLSEPELDHLRKVFGDVDSSYWSSHNYVIDEEPPAPYFSYVIDLNQKQRSSSAGKGFLRTIIDKILRCGPIAETFRNLRRDARYVELWAHNRPHASGHQLHFDSDDEGRSRQQEFPKHPIASTVLNVSSHSRVGGPTLVTTQRLRNPATTHLSSVRGWLVPSRPARLVCFDGSVLHGVIPGKGTIPPPMDDNENDNDEETKEHRPRRVTLMMAFWKDIEVRTGSKPGSARPWPELRDGDEASALPPWATELDRTDVAAAASAAGSSSAASNKWTNDTERSVIPVSHVYELLDGTPVPKYHDDAEDAGDGPYMPEYDRVFQGF